MANDDGGNAFSTKLYGFYKGIVIQNNDPERRGRIKIVSQEMIPQLVRDLDLPEDIYSARFVGGSNINTIFSPDVLRLMQDHLNWAEQAAPLIGGGTAGVFDAKNKLATVGEGHRGELREALDDESVTPSGESVSPKATSSMNGVKGGMDVGSTTGTCDVYNNVYAPSPINNATKGVFSIPRVGSQVWYFFDGGSHDKPIYMAYVFDQNDWNSVVNPQGSNPSLHYPAGSENIQDDEPFFFTGQTVFNTKAGSLEFIETDDFEKIKLSHYSGSVYEMTNHVTNELCTENKATVVQMDEFHTVYGEHTLIVKGDSFVTYMGEHHVTYGDHTNKTLYQDWVDKAAPAFTHAAQFTKKEWEIKDPTTTTPEKKGSGETPNYKFTHPKNNLTLTTNWNALLKGLKPDDYRQQIQHEVLGVA